MDNIIAFDTLKTKVLKYVLYKKRTEQEIRKKFTDCNGYLLEDVIEYLKETGYIDDISYIQRFFSECINLKNLSLKEISFKLYGKGIDKFKIEKYIEGQREYLEEYEKNAAKKIYMKKISTMDQEDIKIFLRKKGFTEDSIESIKKDIENE